MYTYRATRDPFYEESLTDIRMRDANDIVNVLETLRRMEDPWGANIRLMNSIEEMSGVQSAVNSYSNEREYYFEEGSLGMAAKYYIPNAFTRAMREGAMLQDVQMRSMLSYE